MDIDSQLIWKINEDTFTVEALMRYDFSVGDPLHTMTGLDRKTLDDVQIWIQDRNLGKRLGYNTFKLKGKKELILFLLHWDKFIG